MSLLGTSSIPPHAATETLNNNSTSLTNGLINDFNNKVLINDLKAESLNSVLSTRENITTLIDEIEALSK